VNFCADSEKNNEKILKLNFEGANGQKQVEMAEISKNGSGDSSG
jgi:hypothetical protein